MIVELFGQTFPNLEPGKPAIVEATGQEITLVGPTTLRLHSTRSSVVKLSVQRPFDVDLASPADALQLVLTLGPGLTSVVAKVTVRNVAADHYAIDLSMDWGANRQFGLLSVGFDDTPKIVVPQSPRAGEDGTCLLVVDRDGSWTWTPAKGARCRFRIGVGQQDSSGEGVEGELVDIRSPAGNPGWTLRILPSSPDGSLPVDGTHLARSATKADTKDEKKKDPTFCLCPVRLVNGLLQVRTWLEGGSFRREFSWPPHEGSEQVGAILLGLLDEQGLPLAVSLRDRQGWLLDYRRGDAKGRAFDRGLCLTPRDPIASDAGRGLAEISRKVFSTDAVLRKVNCKVVLCRLDWPTTKDTRWRLDKPLADARIRRVLLNDKAQPSAIAGFAQDSRIRKIRPKDGASASLEFTQVADANAQATLRVSMLGLSISGAAWSLENLYAEEDAASELFGPGSAAQPANQLVGVGTWSSKAAQATALVLPLTDVRVCPLVEDPADLSAAWLHCWQQSCSRGLADAFKALEIPSDRSIVGVAAGFQREDPHALPLLSVLGDPGLAEDATGISDPRQLLKLARRRRLRLANNGGGATAGGARSGVAGLLQWLSTLAYAQASAAQESAFGFGLAEAAGNAARGLDVITGDLLAAVERRLGFLERFVLDRPTEAAPFGECSAAICDAERKLHESATQAAGRLSEWLPKVRDRWETLAFETEGCARATVDHLRLLRVLAHVAAGELKDLWKDGTFWSDEVLLPPELRTAATAFDAWWKNHNTRHAALRKSMLVVLDASANNLPPAACQQLLLMLQRMAWRIRKKPGEWRTLRDQLGQLFDEIAGATLDTAAAKLAQALWPGPSFLPAGGEAGKEVPRSAIVEIVLAQPTGLSSLLAMLRVCRDLSEKMDTLFLDEKGVSIYTPEALKSFKRDAGTIIDYLQAIDTFVNDASIPSLRQLARTGEDEVVRLLQEKLWEPWRKQGEAALAGIEKNARDKVAELLRQCPVLDEATLARLRQAEQAVRAAIAAAASLGKDGAELLRQVRNNPVDYVAIGRGLECGLSEGTQSTYASVRESILKLTGSVGRPLSLCDLGSGFSWDFLAVEDSLYLLKLGKRKDLASILFELHTRYVTAEQPDPLRILADVKAEAGQSVQQRIGDWVAQWVDAQVAAPDWQGLFILKPNIDFSKDTVVSEVCGLSRLVAHYVAFSGATRDRPAGAATKESLSVWARVATTAPEEAKKPKQYPDVKDSDGALTLVDFDVHIRNSRLLPASRIELRIDFGRLFGRTADEPGDREKWRIALIGRVVEPQTADQAPYFEFVARFDQPLTIDIDKLFFKTIEFRRIEAVYRDKRVALAVDASIEMKNIDSFIPNGRLDLSDCRLVFPRTGSTSAIGRPRKLRFDFGSLRGALSPLRALTLGSFELEPVSFGYLRNHVDSDKTVEKPDTERQMLDRGYDVVKGAGGKHAFARIGEMPYVVFAVTFGGLPGMDKKGGAKLRINVLAGLAIKDIDGLPIGGNPLLVAAGDLSASNIDINIFRVLRIQIATLIWQQVAEGMQGRKYSAFFMDQFRLDIFGWSLLKPESVGASVLHLQDDAGERGFAVYIPKPESGNLIEVDWLLVGRNLALEADSYISYLTGKGDGKDQPAGSDPAQPATNPLVTLGGSPDYPTIEKIKGGLAGNNAWLFGFSFGVASGGLIKNCALVLQDGVFYGIRLRGDLIKLLFSDKGEPELVVAYQPGRTGKDDRFFFSAPIPALDLFNFGPAGTMVSGLVNLGWSFNTDTLIGLGFPQRAGGKRRWEDAFSFYSGIYQAKFGFYVEKKTVELAEVKDKNGKPVQALVLGGGLAIEFGYGATFGNGWLYIRAGIGIWIVVEGSVSLVLPKAEGAVNPFALLSNLGDTIVAFKLSGEVGVLAYVEGAINIWIISARFRAELQASLGITVDYTKGKPIRASYDATLYAGYYARACIDLGLSEVCYEVQGSYPLRVSGTTTIG